MKKVLIRFLEILGFVILFGGITLFGLYKCTDAVVDAIDDSNDVKNYMVFVEDEVRYELAQAHPDYAYMDFDNSELQLKVQSRISNIASSYEEDQPSYKLALERVCQDGNEFERNYANGLLKIYNELPIDYSEFEQDGEKLYEWHFMEKNSRVRFTASVGGFMLMCFADTWDLNRYTKFLETGVFEDAPDVEEEEIVYPPLEEYDKIEPIDNRKGVTYDEDMEEICSLIKCVYNPDCSNSRKLLSKEFDYLFHTASTSYEGISGWPDWDIWFCTNGCVGYLSEINVEKYSDILCVVHVVIKYYDCGSVVNMDIPMVKENDLWYVDDMITYEENNVSSLKEIAKSLVENK